MGAGLRRIVLVRDKRDFAALVEMQLLAHHRSFAVVVSFNDTAAIDCWLCLLNVHCAPRADNRRHMAPGFRMEG